MSVKVDHNLTRSVARLARLSLSEEELAVLTPQLGEILAYVDQLSSVDVEGVEPLTHPLDLELELREDIARPWAEEGRPGFLDEAPALSEDGYRVPPIL